jgi:cysteinyl-tRNA synthetase
MSTAARSRSMSDTPPAGRCLIRLYNTLTRQQEPFAPPGDGTVRMYACGPTVYARAHIGNFRTFVCIDVLRRTLRHLCGYGMHEAVNYTDVDDKTIAGARRRACRCASTPTSGSRVSGGRRPARHRDAEETPRATDEANLRAMGT